MSRLATSLVRSLPALALTGCFLNAGPYESASNGPGGGEASGTAGAAGEATVSGSGGDMMMTTSGSGAAGGGATGGTGGATGGAGGSGGGLTVEGDLCPGVPVMIPGNTPIVVQGDNGTKDGVPLANDYKSVACGGGNAPELVYAVTAQTSGTLYATLVPFGSYDGVLYIRGECEKESSEIKCSQSAPIAIKVAKGATVFVFVDGHMPDLSGAFKLTLYLDACGNGVIDGNEECDDANKLSGDTCSPECKVSCTSSGSQAGGHDVFINQTTHHCYLQVYSPNRTFQEATDDCKAWGGYLAALTDQPEIDALSGLLPKNGEDCWIGADDLAADGTFVWLDGEVWNYAPQQPPWQNGEPNGGTNENCVEIYTSGRLNDDSCSKSQNYLCERPPAGQAP